MNTDVATRAKPMTKERFIQLAERYIKNIETFRMERAGLALEMADKIQEQIEFYLYAIAMTAVFPDKSEGGQK